MAAETTADTQRQEIYEIAEAIAPTWERRRADLEAVCAPMAPRLAAVAPNGASPTSSTE
jgi:hypothetical protein